MSGSTLPPTTLDAKNVGTFGSLVALTGAITAPVVGDTATLVDSIGATGGVAGVTRKVFWDGLTWVVFDARQNTSTNSTTVLSDASRAPIINSSPSEDNLAGVIEYRSSQSVNFSVQNGVVQANRVLAGTYVAYGGNPALALPFATVSLFTGALIGYNTLNASVGFVPLGITVPITGKYEVISNWWNGFGVTTTVDGFVKIGRGQNGTSLIGGAGQTNSIPAGLSFPNSNVSTPYLQRNSLVYMGILPAGTTVNVYGYQNVVAIYNYAGNVSVGIRQE